MSFPPWMQSTPGCTVGKWTYGQPYIADYGLDVAKITIGSFCAIGRDVWFIRAQHRLDWVSTSGVAEFLLPRRQRASVKSVDARGDIVVGSDVWIGCHVIIMPNVKIGDGVILGAGAIVTRDIPPFAVAAGAPAVVKRLRFSPSIIESLLRIKWWEWDDSLIRERIVQLHSDDIDGFVRKYDSGVV